MLIALSSVGWQKFQLIPVPVQPAAVTATATAGPNSLYSFWLLWPTSETQTPKLPQGCLCFSPCTFREQHQRKCSSVTVTPSSPMIRKQLRTTFGAQQIFMLVKRKRMTKYCQPPPPYSTSPSLGYSHGCSGRNWEMYVSRFDTMLKLTSFRRSVWQVSENDYCLFYTIPDDIPQSRPHILCVDQVCTDSVWEWLGFYLEVRARGPEASPISLFNINDFRLIPSIADRASRVVVEEVVPHWGHPSRSNPVS